jgi:hypothetical protein
MYVRARMHASIWMLTHDLHMLTSEPGVQMNLCAGATKRAQT